MKNSSLIKISTEGEGLSEEQKLFNKLTEEIEKKKKELDKWENLAEDYRQRYTKELFPLENEFYECRKDLVFLFDNRLKGDDFNNGERRKLKRVVYDMCLDLLGERYDDKIEDMLEKYSIPKSKKKTIFDDLFDDFASKMEENYKKYNEENMDEDVCDEWNKEESVKENTAEKESRESIKDIYKRLAVILHPDKELDQKEKERKTGVFQKVTAAYRDKNLTELLKIELEETKSMLNGGKVSEKAMKGLTQALKEEVEELKEKVYLSKRYFQVSFNGLRLSNLSKKKINHLFDQKKEYADKLVRSAKSDLEEFRKSQKSLRKFIRSFDIRQSGFIGDVF